MKTEFLTKKMKKSAMSNIVSELQQIQTRVTHILDRINAEAAINEREYLTVKEFATLVDREPKTISNYCSKGRFSDSKQIDGIWYIHKSHLTYYE